ncbi:hypothetical protein QCA50_007139 [Cerrena zonata]|uniref:Uncharacterized protein n=1 Tax=Cerrena zonata TaxID=2478898 RepID=A0AAW0G6R4_9APHY
MIFVVCDLWLVGPGVKPSIPSRLRIYRIHTSHSSSPQQYNTGSVPSLATYGVGPTTQVNMNSGGYGNIASTPVPFNNACLDLQGYHRSIITCRNDALSNLANAETSTRLSMQLLEASHRAVEQMDHALHSMEVQLGLGPQSVGAPSHMG